MELIFNFCLRSLGRHGLNVKSKLNAQQLVTCRRNLTENVRCCYGFAAIFCTVNAVPLFSVCLP